MKLRFSALFLPAALAFGVFASPAHAMPAADPAALINQLVSQAIGIITDKQESEQDRQAKFRDLLQSGFDIPRISRFVLGRYWNAASDEQRQQFSRLFEDWVVDTYSARFNDYSGETIKVTGTQAESNPAFTDVASQFISPNGAPPAKVTWVVLKSGDNDYRVVDVSVEGVSMALTQRDEIAAVADRSGGTVDGLNQALQQKISGSESESAGK
ncbi:MAG TPA: ABC transporter substrate-binding protein [Stellaceae bacterium]|nr:ABC transporter substrate-binding protein [Stellaceae bacterium]